MFSVIIPYYKKRKFIERCLDSVLAQTYQDFEIILVDDGSEDNLSSLIDEKYNGKINFITQQNQGVSVARNTGISNAKFDFIAFLDADDFWSPFYLEKNFELISAEENVSIIGAHYTKQNGNLELINSELHYLPITDYFKSAIQNTIFFTSATVVEKNFFDNNSAFNPLLKNGEDLDVWFRVILAGGNTFHILNTLVLYSTEDENQATRKDVDVNSSFLFKIPDLYTQFYNKYPNADFDVYITKLMYLGFRQHYFSEQKRVMVKEIMVLRKKNYFLANLYYMIPFSIGKKLNESVLFRRWIRKYFKFLFRYIYNS